MPLCKNLPRTSNNHYLAQLILKNYDVYFLQVVLKIISIFGKIVPTVIGRFKRHFFKNVL